MIEFTLFDYDNNEHWANFEAVIAKVGEVRKAGHTIVEVHNRKVPKGVQRATRLVVQFENEDEAMFFKLAHL